MKPQRLQQAHHRVELGTRGVHTLLRAGVGGHDHGQAMVFGHGVEHRHQLGERLFRFDVLFAVGAHHKVTPSFQRQTRQHI